MELGLSGRRVLITAGAAGIGLEMARAFAAEGATVRICDIDAKAVAALEHSQRVTSMRWILDLSRVRNMMGRLG